MTLDSEIDKVLPSTCLTHFRSAQDDYFATELVDDEIEPPGRVGFDDYANFFVEHANAAHLRFEQSPYQIAIQQGWLAGPTQMPAEDAKLCFKRICDLLERRLELFDHFERPHVTWVVLKTFAEMDLSEHDRQLITDATETARVELISRAYKAHAEGRFFDLDSMLARC